MPEEPEVSTLKKEAVNSSEPTVQKEPDKEIDIVSWESPARPFKRRNREFWVTIVAIAAVVGLVLLFVEGFMPVLLIISMVFLFYVLSTVEPEKILYKVTNKGIRIAERLTPWEDMGRFWFTRRFDANLLAIESNNIAGRMEMVVDGVDKESLKKAISEYLKYEEVPGSRIDKAAIWFSKKMPGNR